MSTPPDPLAAALRDALEAERSTADDAALIARAVARATSRLTATSPSTSTSADSDGPRGAATSPTPRSSTRVVALTSRPRARLIRVALPLAAAFAASVALASVYFASRGPAVPPTPPTEVPEPPPAKPIEPARGQAATNIAAETPTISVNDLPSAKPSTAVTAEHVWLPLSPPPDSHVTAAELFRDANAERRTGNVGKAVDLYVALQKRFPDSSETHASRVSLGRLLLDRQGDATGALAQFDAYLNVGAADGTLAEEARLGRALAYQRLGRADAERAAWEELVARHPATLHSSRARERLRALDGSTP